MTVLAVSTVSGTATAQPPDAAPPAMLRLAWKSPVDPTAYRIALADTAGDGKQRLITLGPTGKLTVGLWDGKAFAAEWTAQVEVGGRPLIAAGRFAPGVKAAQIIVPPALVSWEPQPKIRPAAAPLQPVGVTRRTSGEELLLLRDRADYRACPISLGDPWLGTGGPLEAETAYSWALLHAAPAELEAGVPPEYAASGLIGLWKPPGVDTAVRVLARWSSKAAPAGAYLVLARDLAPDRLTELYRSPALDGRVADIAVGDPKGEGVEGIAVLTASADGKGRVLAFFVPGSAPAGSGPAAAPTVAPRSGQRATAGNP